MTTTVICVFSAGVDQHYVCFPRWVCSADDVVSVGVPTPNRNWLTGRTTFNVRNFVNWGRSLGITGQALPPLARCCRPMRSSTVIWLRFTATILLATSRRRTWFAVGRVVPAMLASVSWVTGIVMR